MNDIEYNDFINKIEEEAKAKNEEFNIFTALHNVRDERRLHSRFIAFLLNPKSKHQKGNVFLEAFLKELDIPFETNDCNVIVKPSESNNWAEEKNIDILVENGKQAIIIENKIDAGDSDHNDKEEGNQIQLERYYNEVKSNYKFNDAKIYIVYLTINGREPHRYNDIKRFEKRNLKCIGYGNIIRKWLKECEDKTKDAVFLNTVIQQYKNITEKIAPDIEKMKVIGDNWEVAFKNEKTLKLENFNHVKWHTIYDFWNELTKELKTKNYHIDFDAVDQITNVAFKSGTTTSIAFHKNPDQILYIANDWNGFTLGKFSPDNPSKKKWDFFTKDSVKKIKFSDFSISETFQMINQTKRKEVIAEIVNVIENFPTLSRGSRS